jgi:hypothetical protein
MRASVTLSKSVEYMRRNVRTLSSMSSATPCAQARFDQAFPGAPHARGHAQPVLG